jgi:hypothetical protein
MLKSAGAALVALGLVLLAGCGPKSGAATPTVNESMTKIMQPEAQVIWDITSKAFNFKGDGLDPTKVTPTDWSLLEQAGQKMKDRGAILATAKHVVVAAPGAAIMGAYAAPPGDIKTTWDAASAKQIQALIDANPGLFAQRAKILSDTGDTLMKAAGSKDINTLYQVSADLDEVCDGCHQKFWGTDEPPPFPAKIAQGR